MAKAREAQAEMEFYFRRRSPRCRAIRAEPIPVTLAPLTTTRRREGQECLVRAAPPQSAERCHAGRPQLGDDRCDVRSPGSRHGPPRGQRSPPRAIVDPWPRKPPRMRPRALAAARADLVRSEIAFASCSATAARIWIVRRFACGKSTATDSTPLSMRDETKWTFLASLSSLAMTSVAPWRRHRRSASASFGRSAFLPDSTSTTSLTSFHRPAFR
jgi:hypothetical protein